MDIGIILGGMSLFGRLVMLQCGILFDVGRSLVPHFLHGLYLFGGVGHRTFRSSMESVPIWPAESRSPFRERSGQVLRS